MDPAASITITGIDDITRKLEKLGKEASANFGKIAKRAMAIHVETPAKDKCPVDTGNLRASIRTEQTDEFEVRVGTTVEYAPYVEYGTSRQPAQPYLRPAFDENKGTVIERIKADLEKIVEAQTK